MNWYTNQIIKTVPPTAVLAAMVFLAFGGAVPAAAHFSTNYYYNIVVDIQEYQITEYGDFDLVRMKVSIENLDITMGYPNFALVADTTSYYHVTYSDVRGKGGDVSVNDCVSADRFSTINKGGTGETNICFMVGKQFEPEALFISQEDRSHGETGRTCGWESWASKHWGHSCQLAIQVVPFHDEAVACFVNNASFCNQNNIQTISGIPEPPPPPEPEPMPEPEQEPTALLHTIYNNHTGTLTLVFDQLVVAHNPDRVSLIHDIEAFIENGEAPGLGNAELYTVDNKRQSAVLAFKLPDVMRLEVMESLQTHGDLALMIDTRAIYAAEGFVDITRPDNSPLLVIDVMVVR